ncbi:MAG: hypothetical protein ABI200_05790 [Gaiellales bacterium]
MIGTAAVAPTLVAHGLAVQVQDLPLPLHVFYWGAAAALAVSFGLLAFGAHRIAPGKLVKRPDWEAAAATDLDESPPASLAWSIIAGGLGLFWLALTIATALFGSLEGAGNPSPNLVFVLGWIGIPVAAVVLGRAALRLHGPLALARLGGIGERSNTPPPRALGVWLAWAGLVVFVWLELVYPTASHVRLLGWLVLGWTFFVVAAASRWGAGAVREHIDPFATYARVISALSPWWRNSNGRLRLRVPLLGANQDLGTEQYGFPMFATFLIGSVSFDGLTRTDWWQTRVSLATANLDHHGISPDNARVAFGTFGLVVMLTLAYCLFEAAAWGSARIGRFDRGPHARMRAAALFAPSLIPIALAYVVAHYFSFFVVQVQDLARYASDPFDRGWDLFHTSTLKIADLWIPTGTTVWLVEVFAIVTGHIAGLLLAHDRALECVERHADGKPNAARATLSQLPMLALMLTYTVAGLYFLSEGLR